MLFAYLTVDLVNQELALAWAEEDGMTLAILWPRDGLGREPYDGLLIDLDSLPEPEREQIWCWLLCGPRSLPIAVHSYHLGAEQAARLGTWGVAVFPRLAPHVLVHLKQAALAAQAAEMPEHYSPPRSPVHRASRGSA